ncbi:MAG: hypothetical protein WAM60_24535 [Candidatus Promineifilaceae bacterium]
MKPLSSADNAGVFSYCFLFKQHYSGRIWSDFARRHGNFTDTDSLGSGWTGVINAVGDGVSPAAAGISKEYQAIVIYLVLFTLAAFVAYGRIVLAPL